MAAADPIPRARVAVLLSGTGSLCAALLAATEDPAYPAEVVVVGSDRNADGLEHARRRGIPTFTCAVADHPDRAAWDRALAAELGAFEPDLVVSAGFMKLVGPAVLDAFGGRLINTHPALLPAFRARTPSATRWPRGVRHRRDGARGRRRRRHRAGPHPAAGRRPPGDDEARLHERIKAVERELLVHTVAELVTASTRENPR